jgi:hypothetical protein
VEIYADNDLAKDSGRLACPSIAKPRRDNGLLRQFGVSSAAENPASGGCFVKIRQKRMKSAKKPTKNDKTLAIPPQAVYNQ